jgi:GH24 family phage-related lysozyme (muramidase)
MMITTWNQSADFNQELLAFLTKVEGKHYEARDVGDGNVTIGTGFNISEVKVRDVVFSKFGITLEDDIVRLPTQAARDAELKYWTLLTDAIRDKNIGALDGIMADRASDPALQDVISDRRTNFRFRDDDEIFITLKEDLVPIYSQKIWDKIPELKTTDSFLTSKERIALISLSYNTKDGATTLLGTNLCNALKNGNRAEAWYEIRYNSNKDSLTTTPPNTANGTAKEGNGDRSI